MKHFISTNLSWACLGNEHEKCTKSYLVCDCECHTVGIHKKIMDDIRANSSERE